MKKRIFLLVLVFLLGGVLSAQEKVGYVNMVKLFEEYYRSVEANVTFEEKKLGLQKEMKELRMELEGLLKEVRKAEEEAGNELLGARAKEQAIAKYRMRAENFQKKHRAFEERRIQALESLQQMQRQSEEALSSELVKLLKAFAKAKGYGQIWDVSGKSLNRLPVLLVYPEEQDLTKLFIEAVNHDHQEALAAASKKVVQLRKLNDILAKGGDLPAETSPSSGNKASTK